MGPSFLGCAAFELLVERRANNGVPRPQLALPALAEVEALEKMRMKEQEQGLEQGRVLGVRGPGEDRPVEVIEPERALLDMIPSSPLFGPILFLVASTLAALP